MTVAPGFTGSTLDRADAVRGDPAALAALRARPDARRLVLAGLDPALGPDDRLVRAPLEAGDGLELAFLGFEEGAPLFVALDVSAPPSGMAASIFQLLDRLPGAEAGLYAAARSLVDWHARHRFCAGCGAVTTTFRAGWGRKCPGCGREHFPRTDPVVIMLAEHESGPNARVLVGRQAAWPADRYSALAGFVEVGESLEEAVARELFEEAGVSAEAVRFVASQPWPFPSQLMIACIATVADDALRLDATEIEAAIWVTREEVRASLAGAADARFLPPPHYAIAHTLLQRWVTGASEQPASGEPS